MIPNGELNFRLKFRIDICNFCRYKWIERIESGLKNTGLDKNNRDFLKVLDFQSQDSLSGFNVIRRFHDFDKDIFPDLGYKMETFGQLNQLFSLSSEFTDHLQIFLIVVVIVCVLFVVRNEVFPPISQGSVGIPDLIESGQENVFLSVEFVGDVLA